MKLFSVFLIVGLWSCSKAESQNHQVSKRKDAIVKSNDEWKKELPQDVYHIMREQGTERAFTGKYWDNHEKGMYLCAACQLPLFSADAKFESGTGWPSFFKPAADDVVESETDKSLGMVRTEVHCARCGGHLGHIFDDGPKPTGLRYCINSASLNFKKDE